MGESDEEDYVSFGCALDPLDEDNLPRKKPITIEEQVATDAQGRRRFHGAFTGGFSAGYFNSVGTRDGWRPQQFKSSRSSKANNVGQRPEDFMDEEDTGEFGIAPSGIRATNDFTDHSKGTKRQRSTTNNDGPIPGVPVLQDLLKPITDTVGVVLLKKMGWKPGQGVGPRVTKIQKQKTRKRNEKKKIYGCSLPNQEVETTKSCTESSEDDEDDDDDGEEILFAPDDYEPFRSNPKDNFFGIGYSGLDRRSVLGHINLFGDTTFKMQDKNKKLSIRGQAFGVGAFEADDEDIYAREDMSNYDFTLGPAEAKKKLQKSINSGAKCLEGFVSAKNSLVQKKLFKPPELPRDYKPIHVVRQSRFSPQKVPENIDDNHKRKGLGRHDLNAETRSAILGESSRSSPVVNIITKTLNLYGKEKTEERAKQESAKLKSSTSWMDKLKTTRFVRAGAEGNNDEENKNRVQMTKPFSDEAKQKRFEKFQEFNAEERREKLEKLQPLSMTDWERNQELQDFDLALKLSCKNNNDSGPVDNDDKLSKIVIDEAPKDPMIEAAKSKMFGKLTRSLEEWQPTSIVCKRFNIPEPMTGCAPQDVKTNKRYSVFDSLTFITDDKFKKATDTSGSYELPNIPYKSSNKNINNSMNILDTTDIVASTSNDNKKINNFEKSYEKVFGSLTNDNQDNSSKVHETATSSSSVSLKDKNNEKKDLFKAIFLSSSDEDSDKNDGDDDDDNDVTSDAIKNVLIGKPANVVNIERNNSPPRGIFAKLDLDNLLKPDKNLIKANDNTDSSNDQLNLQNNDQIDIDMYGPVLPKKLPEIVYVNIEKQDKEKYKNLLTKLNNSIEWVEKTKDSKKIKKDKKKHKHKDKKHKHKSKKSKK
ncbi:hypothetical protein HCN44_006509 [Aphidius gifuensis]|uniref:G-patch domain-containing protein n=1 Tax=Aphidius gifuensis TaxID=684658 RepID=A0A835CTI2_APHGI|nr:G patch domain-containing protein 1 homolog [Aphidius gifuensis]KAF7995402.1 hypothetical protein HCN44_006509 [Aphidius gifuensis]